MPIEFACSRCSQLLQVPDNAAGQQAKCPNCSQFLQIPTSVDGLTQNSNSTEPVELDGSSPQSLTTTGDAVVNPFSSPTAELDKPRQFDVTSGPIQNQAVDAGSVISYAWKIWTTNLGLLVGVSAVVIMTSFGLNILIDTATTLLIKAQGEMSKYIAAILLMGGDLASQAVVLFLGIGQTQIALNLARCQPARFADLFGGKARFLPVLGGSILFAIALAVGFTLCIIPGMLLLLFCWPFYYLVVDNQAKVINSFSTAYTIVKGNILTSFLLGLANLGIAIAGFLALCVGIVFALPLISTIWAVAYLMMSGQISTRPSIRSR